MSVNFTKGKVINVYQQLEIIPKIAPITVSAGKIMLTAGKNGEYQTKLNAKDFVTKYDSEVQNYLFSELKKVFPNAKFIGEEGKSEKININQGEVFIIDPIDGTRNFVAGLNLSAVSVGYLVNGEVVAGSVYNPFTKEHFYAEKGKGSYLNGEKISVNQSDLVGGLVAVGTAVYYDELLEKTKRIISDIIPKCNDIRRLGAASLDICYVASGRFCGFCEVRLQPYDYAGANIILTEAGGILTDFNGEKISFEKCSSVVCGNKKSYFELKEITLNS